ncbi:MAG: hypothetical protein AB7N24_08625 [Dehalococcoidia bacterium]
MVLLTLLLLCLLIASYVGVMHAVVDVSKIANDHDANQRDRAYAFLHIVMILGAGIIGFVTGKWFNGLGIAFAALFVIVIAVGMLSVQLTSYELACHGHNDLVRHWQC